MVWGGNLPPLHIHIRMATKMNQQASAWGVVIDPPHAVGREDLCKYFNNTLSLIPILSKRLGYQYATIIHDCDDDENGNPKRAHLHLVMWGKKRHTKSAVLNLLQDNLEGQIQVDKVLYLEEALRYLIHQGYEDKYQYEIDEIKTDDVSKVQTAMKNIDKEIDGPTLFDIIMACDFDRVKIIMAIGPQQYCRLYRAIDVIIHEVA